VCLPTTGRREQPIYTYVPTDAKRLLQETLSEGLPIESHLPTHLLHDYFLAEIAVKTIENKQVSDAMVNFRRRYLINGFELIYILL
jgi:hypothetical protein